MGLSTGKMLSLKLLKIIWKISFMGEYRGDFTMRPKTSRRLRRNGFACPAFAVQWGLRLDKPSSRYYILRTRHPEFYKEE
jgi:hypothetical protein